MHANNLILTITLKPPALGVMFTQPKWPQRVDGEEHEGTGDMTYTDQATGLGIEVNGWLI